MSRLPGRLRPLLGFGIDKIVRPLPGQPAVARQWHLVQYRHSQELLYEFPAALPPGLTARRPALPADAAAVIELVRSIDARYVGRPSQPAEQVVACRALSAALDEHARVTVTASGGIELAA